MTYNHDKAKVTCSECAREVGRLREVIDSLITRMGVAAGRADDIADALNDAREMAYDSIRKP